MVENQKVRKSGYVYAEKRSKVCIQGRNATKTGRTLENFVEETLVTKGAFPVSHTKWANGKIVIPGWVDKVLYKQVNYTKPWGDKGYSDFVLQTPDRTIRIDARYQGVGGSVEDKVPFLFIAAEKCYPEKEVIIVLDGPGVKSSIRTWLVEQAAAAKQKSIKVMTKAQFKSWVNNSL